MDTDKARNITISMLILLNILLLVCNILFADNNKYYMSKEQLRNITEVLNQNGITLNSKINRSFSPKTRLEMLLFEYDSEQLVSIFMNGEDPPKFSVENNRRIYRTDWESLAININTGYVVYRNLDAGTGESDPDYARDLCGDFIKKINAVYPGFVPDVPTYSTEEGLTFEYCQMYRGYTVNSNRISVTVSENTISRAEFICARIAGFESERTMICPTDEILLTCLHEIKNMYGDAGVSIDKIDLVYQRLENSGIADPAVYAQPFYRIYISESAEPILVNAYTNTVLNL